MIPRAAVLHSPESVIEAVTRSDWTLRETIDTVHVHCEPLPDAVPMDTGPITLHLVADDDCDVLISS